MEVKRKEGIKYETGMKAKVPLDEASFYPTFLNHAAQLKRQRR